MTRHPAWASRPMRPPERRAYDALCAYLAHLAARAHARWKQETTDDQRWSDDGGPPAPAR
jgi:hypothetical protein